MKDSKILAFTSTELVSFFNSKLEEIVENDILTDESDPNYIRSFGVLYQIIKVGFDDNGEFIIEVLSVPDADVFTFKTTKKFLQDLASKICYLLSVYGF